MMVVVVAAAAWVDLWVLSSFSSSLGSNVWSAVPTATDRFSHLLREQNDFGFLRYAHLAHGILRPPSSVRLVRLFSLSGVTQVPHVPVLLHPRPLFLVRTDAPAWPAPGSPNWVHSVHPHHHRLLT